MTLSRALLFASPFVAAGAVMACHPESERAPDQLDCTWVNSQTDNCWRPFVLGVDQCLGQADAGSSAIGHLSDDRLSCVYLDGGRTITAALPLDRPREGDPDAADPLQRSFVVRSASGALCLSFQQNGATATATGPDGSVTWVGDGTQLTITCPDGTTVKGAASDLLDCLTSNGLPGYAYLNTDAGAYFSLLGMKGPAYSCAAAIGATIKEDAGDGG